MSETTPRGKLTLQIVAMPKDTNANGDIFGGWLVSQMDMAAAIEGRHHAKSRVVTVSIEQLNFIRPVYVGDTVACYADLIRIGNTSMKISIQVWTMPLQEETIRKVAEGVFNFVAIDENRKPHAVKRD